jgi:hypothetical protein
MLVSVDGMVEFVTGGKPGSLTLVLSDTGGSVTVGSVAVDGAVVETPVPGPVIPSVGPRTEVSVGVAGAVAFGDGSKTLEMAEPISLRRELSGLPGSELLALVVTMPVGASRIPDVLVVGTGGSSDVGVSSGAAGLLVGVSSGVPGLLVGVSSGVPGLLVGVSSGVPGLLVGVSSGVPGLLVDVGSSSTVLLVVLPGSGSTKDKVGS